MSCQMNNPLFAVFLFSLFSACLFLVAVKGYRSSLTPVIRLYGQYVPSVDPHLTSMIRNFGTLGSSDPGSEWCFLNGICP
jgi:hypothetical protein